MKARQKGGQIKSLADDLAQTDIGAPLQGCDRHKAERMTISYFFEKKMGLFLNSRPAAERDRAGYSERKSCARESYAGIFMAKKRVFGAILDKNELGTSADSGKKQLGNGTKVRARSRKKKDKTPRYLTLKIRVF